MPFTLKNANKIISDFKLNDLEKYIYKKDNKSYKIINLKIVKHSTGNDFLVVVQLLNIDTGKEEKRFNPLFSHVCKEIGIDFNISNYS